MIEIHLADPAVQAAIIGAVGSVFAAAIAAICAGVLGHQIAGRKRMKALLQAAVDDIAFLLTVEEEHCNLQRQFMEESFKQRIRSLARDRGMTWSGRFTPGRVRAMSLLNED